MTGFRILREPRQYPAAFWGALAAELVVQTGFGAILPLLPQFVRSHGFPLADMGLMAASYAAVSFLAQAWLGGVADRWGRKRLMVAGGMVETLGTAGFLLRLHPAGYIGCRILQGVGSAAVVPAANALVADVVDEDRRGRAYGLMAAAGSAGFAIGPMMGGVAGAAWGLAAPFVVGVILNLIATVVMMLTLPTTRLNRRPVRMAHQSLSLLLRPIWPYFWVMFAWMGLSGMYDTTWSLYMESLGAGKWVIGLSFTLFALPLLLFNVLGGRLADRRLQRHWIILAGTGLQTMTVAFYVVSHSAWLSIAVSVLEAAAMSLTGPALSASVMDTVSSEHYGAVQGWFQASGTLGAAMLALASGPLLVGHANHPFILGSALLLVTTLGVAGVWRPWRRRTEL
ncbi:MAG: MFS transporter [Sulfobacillus acidophilus]|uniref:MFS transporter n=1 Tax=Sulfobacillus acidophilus TaxID=53633 RepID=A0A2T2WNF8_9FIRM|nr:MAG: MFS transporter [Sulfobacillus acidophilus]